MSEIERCALCGFVLDERAVVVSEGKLCNDSMGCRRRALAQETVLLGGLRRISAPNRAIKPSGEDARAMSVFAHDVLDEFDRRRR